MWRIVLVALCVVGGILLAAMISAIRGVERAWKRGAPREETTFADEIALAVERAGQIGSGGTGSAVALAGVQPSPSVDNGAATAIQQNVPPPRELWVDSEYCWVVVCKNHLFHRHPNIFNVHRIPLGQTDAVMPRPAIREAFLVQCDECKKAYLYKPSKVLRYEMAPPPSFVPHALFK